ncbi:MAG: uracil-DNA glycosylase [Ignavibacteriae bacterium]|nr:uracil-DNA glycosylase [Ignavibacteria bacterium]MBI3364236.1 uracil-DNA glycosylase [Ignavibacteriota bacterium]
MKESKPGHTELQRLQSKIIRCKRCPRLVSWREKVAEEKVARYNDWEYWGKPIPSFGDPDARLLLVGLAPAAHGGNRTGRMFTGDRSGDWLYRALYKFGFANQPQSISTDDGLQLMDCYITATARCAPPQNKLLPEEIRNCRPYLLKELQLLKNIRVIVALGKIGFDTIFDSFRTLEITSLPRRPAFGHGGEYTLNDRQTLIASFHPSQQNTFTGKLTEKMFDAVFRRARKLLDSNDSSK